MTIDTLLPRSAVPTANTWDVDGVYPDGAAWDSAATALEALVPGLASYRGRLTESGATLLAWIRDLEQASVKLARLYVYAGMQFDTDTANPDHAARWQRLLALVARYDAALSFEVPELLAAGRERVEAVLAESPDLARYRHRFDKVLRRAPHVRSAEVEELLALITDPLGGFFTARSSLIDADLPPRPVAGSDGADIEVAEGTIGGLLESPDRAVRQRAWEAYADNFLSVRRTVAALLIGQCKGVVFDARARKYDSARAAAMDFEALPPVVFDHVVSAFRDHVDIWHRYWGLRRRALAVDRLAVWDIWAPLTTHEPPVSYDQACQWIIEGMAPLGNDYVTALTRGLGDERWVDIYPNQGKRGGAYSGGGYDTHPFILMNWTGGLRDMSILAHELGHSMHSYFSRQSQPPSLADYSSFVAEVASNFNQALVRAHLLATHDDPYFQIALIGEAMSNFHRYLFIMPILAQFEDAVYHRVEAGEGLTADDMSALMASLFQFGYGDGVAMDAPRVGITWAQFPHLYMNFYAFQYATGIAAANTLADDVLAGAPGARDRYLDFLKTGGSRYPIDALRLAGVDMATRAPLDRAFAVLSGFVERLDGLLTQVGA